ncbi:MAG TPA: diaminopimelate decarboxylase [Thermomicrobiales bacterium]|nr:diaminopimelate decarboxylase [Thermomicrobiales bacterium]
MGNAAVWPITAERAHDGSLWIGGVPVAELARELGTPLYLYDVETIRRQCRLYVSTFSAAYPRSRVAYAGKAWLSTALLRVIEEEGLSLDVVSGGELAVALASGFPPRRMHFHGNNKAPDELRQALGAGVGSIIIDNFDEIDLLAALTRERDGAADVMLRLNPGIDVHTHNYRKTGIPDSKFGLGIATGDAARAVERILAVPGLRLRGYHAHIGSQIFEIEPFTETVDALFAFAAETRDRHGIIPDEISPGGGFGIPYEDADLTTPIDSYAQDVAGATVAAARRWDMPEPELTVEPGRSIVGQAGVAVYTLGARKHIPGVRTYVSVDGGMADNIRPALYGARYTAELVRAPSTGATSPVTIAGKYCESGDVLIDRVELPEHAPGDLLAVPATGAYCLAMASNYNLSLRPAVAFVEGGSARLAQRRETVDDLLRREASEYSPLLFASIAQS